MPTVADIVAELLPPNPTEADVAALIERTMRDPELMAQVEALQKRNLQARLGRPDLDCLQCLQRLAPPDPGIPVESFSYQFDDGEVGSWSMDRAQQLIAAGEVPLVPVAGADLDTMLTDRDYTPGHEDHIPPEAVYVPGVLVCVALLVLTDDQGRPTGQQAASYALADGTHRARLAQREGRTFWAYMLTPEQSEACELRLRLRVEGPQESWS